MTKRPGGPPARIFHGPRGPVALSVIVLLSEGVRLTIRPFLEPVAALRPHPVAGGR